MDFISSLFDSFVLLLEYVGHAFTSILSVVAHIPMFVDYVGSVVDLIPDEIKFFALLSVSLSVLMMFVPFIKTDGAGD